MKTRVLKSFGELSQIRDRRQLVIGVVAEKYPSKTVVHLIKLKLYYLVELSGFN